MAYTVKDPRPPTEFFVPNRNKKVGSGKEKKEEEKKSKLLQGAEN